MIEIDQGIYIPPVKVGRPRKYPLADLKVGESFFAPGKRREDFGLSSHLPKKFTTRLVTEKRVRGTRVWRVE